MQVYAQQNDNLDAILYRHFGRSEGLLEITCELNPHLMNKPIIPIGTQSYCQMLIQKKSV